MDGYGKLIYSNRDIYEVEFKNNYRDGKGKFIWNEDDFYEGEWINDFRNGYGIYLDSNGVIYGVMII